MNKYFFTSDIHSFASCFKDALKRAGFRKTNKEHILVVLGDIFDRGFETVEVYNYLMSIPKKRRVMIRGNHELLYLELLNKSFPESHDFSNGTVRTFCHIANIPEEELNIRAKLSSYYIFSGGKNDPREKARITDTVKKTWLDVKEKVAENPITKWLQSNEWVNYFEVDDLICVHSFIPLRIKKISETKWIRNYPVYQVNPKLLEVVKNWRTEASQMEWEDATWGCPYMQFDAGLFDDEIKINSNKKLICGHWRVNDFHNNYQDSPDDDMNLSLYFGKNFIGLDACTVLSQFCNVLVYDQETHKYYDQFQNELTVKTKDREGDLIE